MILEQAIFPINPGQAQAFEAAFAQARRYIQASPGFQKLEMRACIEVADRYLLLVWWDSMEAHMKGFRESEGFTQWRALLGPHFAAPPDVHHFAMTL
jgi:heme-degrading monooxygenase HmoA